LDFGAANGRKRLVRAILERFCGETVDVGAPLSRRAVIGAGVALFVAACSKSRSTRSSATATTTATATGGPTSLPPTPSCGGGTQATVAQTEGPYFKPNSPEKANLAADVNKGTHLVVAGSVLSTSCQPVSHALIDVWQADADGQYDNAGNTLRGHLFSDSSGHYRFVTVVPGLYPGRTRHIHVKVQAPNGPVLTTQLYFPGEPRNAGDSIFQKELLMAVTNATGGSKDATFDFVVRTA
jgi:protocatechuate 3,4-dioxygenase beta subunit